MKDERGRGGTGRKWRKGSTGLWGKVAISNKGLYINREYLTWTMNLKWASSTKTCQRRTAKFSPLPVYSLLGRRSELQCLGVQSGLSSSGGAWAQVLSCKCVQIGVIWSVAAFQHGVTQDKTRELERRREWGHNRVLKGPTAWQRGHWKVSNLQCSFSLGVGGKC